MTSYKILRPPLSETFPLPYYQLLLEQKPGNHVKLIFQVDDEKPERMWVTLTDCSSSELWKGKIDNDATQPKTMAELPADTEISFHPLDIISVWIETSNDSKE